MAIQAGRVGVRADQVDAYGRVNDTSFFNKIIDKLITWVDLPVWKGGTEQLLPENDDEPKTSPILCDIDYPDQERKNQYFTYRESPTGSDGIAKIESIRGNTLVWNQLVNGITTSTADGITTEYDSANHEFKITNNSRTTNYGSGSTRGAMTDSLIIGHKYLILTSPIVTGVICSIGSGNDDKNNSIYTATSTTAVYLRITNAYDFVSAHPVGSVTKVKIKVHDLTAMGLDTLTVAQFTSLFPLPYYAYDTGSLLNFTADKIKTVGKNLCIRTNENSNIYNAGNLIPVKQGDEIWVYADYSTTSSNMWTAIYALPTETNKNNYIAILGYVENGIVKKITITNDGYFGIAYGGGVSTYTINKIMIATTSFTANDYEPYTTNTLELPISTFFPTGMKSVGEVYDELLPRRATTRVGQMDMGSLTWTKGNELNDETGFVFYSQTNSLTGSAKNNNIKCAIFVKNNNPNAAWETLSLGDIIEASSGRLVVGASSSYADGTAFKTAMNGVMLNYELAEPIVLPTIDFE